MTSPLDEKRELAERWLHDPRVRLSDDDRALLEEYVRRYPDDATLTPVDRKRLTRQFALLADRLSASS